MRKIVLLAMVLIMTGAFGLAWAGPLAPLAKISDGLEMLVKPGERQVPDASKVGIPAYPGSLFCTIKTGDMGESAWSQVQLLSEEPYEKVSAWYRKKMEGWYCNERIKGMIFFCSDKDPGPAWRLDPEIFNVVDVLNLDVAFPCDLPGMQTAITIKFQPD